MEVVDTTQQLPYSRGNREPYCQDGHEADNTPLRCPRCSQAFLPFPWGPFRWVFPCLSMSLPPP